MGKGGSNEIKETEAQKAAAAVALDQWKIYKNDLQQYEDLFMDKADELNLEPEYDNIAGTSALGTAQGFGEARSELSVSLAAQGVDPMSGRYQAQMNELETEQALSQTDTSNRAQSSQQDRYVAGLKDVVSIGAGQKAEALAGMDDLANTSLRKAAHDAQTSFQNKMATAGLVGTMAGAGTAYGLKEFKTGSSPANKKISPTASVLQGKGY
ncbi:hypothetical protein BTN33_22425 [Aeromonas veronii]|uniref:hypothetical protein n=1 Tax=Aeromonas veronii TaxID=654 RepID=UPI0009470354|nr:hypothetical protein [Aeromonas veronii]OLF56863.1 hypothetical protein BTN33_22425 [Aeromonas veronii]TNJ04116.1 hypothetical protein CF115_18495 [Aeromonas veronii]